MVEDFLLMVWKHETRAALAFALTALAFFSVSVPDLKTNVIVAGCVAMASNGLLWWMSMAFVWRLRHKPWPLIYQFYYAKHRSRLPILSSTSDFYYDSDSDSCITTVS